VVGASKKARIADLLAETIRAMVVLKVFEPGACNTGLDLTPTVYGPSGRYLYIFDAIWLLASTSFSNLGGYPGQSPWPERSKGGGLASRMCYGTRRGFESLRGLQCRCF
jgi:hypothetical protein